MSRILKPILVIFLTICFCQTWAVSKSTGYISGTLVIDDSWDQYIYLSLVEVFEKEYAISNNLISQRAVIDSNGNFKIELKGIPEEWSLLRLHIVKKGVSSNSLIIGGEDENHIFLVATSNSEIKLFTTEEKPIFNNARIDGAPYMNAFGYIKKLSNYPNSIDYTNALIEKEFIEEVIFDKLKIVADTCNHPLISLYALHQIDFLSDYHKDPVFYRDYLAKWKNEDSPYFKSFRLKLSAVNQSLSSRSSSQLIYYSAGVLVLVFIGVGVYRKRKPNIKKLSVQERKIFDLLRKGMSNKEISAECNIELTTVKSHLTSIYSKMKIKSRKEAMDIAIKP